MRILIADKHDLFRQGLKVTLHECFGSSLISSEANSFTDMKVLMADQRFDLIITGTNILSNLKQSILRNIWYGQTQTPVLAAIDESTPDALKRLNEYKVNGFIFKSANNAEYKQAFQTLVSGENLPFPKHLRKINSSEILTSPRNLALTNRQNEVLSLMSQGQSNRDIAANLTLSEGTVKVHVTAIFRALGVKSRTQAVLLSQESNTSQS